MSTLKKAVKAASASAYNEDADMVVGYQPSLGWVYRHEDDEAAIADLEYSFKVNSAGAVTHTIDEQLICLDWDNETIIALFPTGDKIVFSGPDQEIS